MRYVLNFIGMKPFAYWFGSLICDYSLACLPTFMFMIIVIVGGVDALSSKWYIVLGTVLAFLFPLVTLTYAMTFLFKKSERAFRLIGTVYMLTGYLIPVTLLNLGQAMSESTYNTVTIIFGIFIPFVPFFNTMVGIVIEYLVEKINDGKPLDIPISSFQHWYYSVPLMLVQGVVFFIITLIIDYNV